MSALKCYWILSKTNCTSVTFDLLIFLLVGLVQGDCRECVARLRKNPVVMVLEFPSDGFRKRFHIPDMNWNPARIVGVIECEEQGYQLLYNVHEQREISFPVRPNKYKNQSLVFDYQFPEQKCRTSSSNGVFPIRKGNLISTVSRGQKGFSFQLMQGQYSNLVRMSEIRKKKDEYQSSKMK